MNNPEHHSPNDENHILDTLTQSSREHLLILAQTSFHKWITKKRWTHDTFTVAQTIERLQEIEGAEKWIEPLSKLDSRESLQVVITWLYILGNHS